MTDGKRRRSVRLHTKTNRLQVRPMMEACGIDVFKTARRNGFQVDTRKETYGGWNFFALVLID